MIGLNLTTSIMEFGNPGRTVDPMASVMRQKNWKLRALSNKCGHDFIGQSVDEISHFSLLRHCLRPSKWRVRRSTGRNFRSIDKLKHPFEPHFNAESKVCTHLSFSLISRRIWHCQSWENWQRPIFDLAKTVWPMSHPSRTRSPPAVFPLLLDV